MRKFRYEEIDARNLGATDLQEERDFQTGPMRAFRIYVLGVNGQPLAEAAEALYVRGRLGIAWGTDATWADVWDIETGIDTWLNDPDSWDLLN